MRIYISLAMLAILAWLPPAAHATEGAQGDGQQTVVIVSKSDDVPERVRRQIAGLLKKKCPAGNKLRVTLGKFYDMGHSSSTNKIEPYIASYVPLNAAGKPDGLEEFITPRSPRPHRTVTYRNGVKHGPETLYREGKRSTEVPWQEGIITGVRRTYHLNGKVGTETGYVNGVAEGKSQSYDNQGRLSRDCVMKGGQRTGVLTDFWPETGRHRRVIPYDLGKVNGTMREFYANGQLKREMPFRQDALHGVEKQFEADGTPTRTRYWIDGEMVSKDTFAKRSK